MKVGLEGLEDALPTVPKGDKAPAGELNSRTVDEESGKIKHKSLKSRPGAGKKKEKLVAAEMERFAKNMALMSAGPTKTLTAKGGDNDVQTKPGLKEAEKVDGPTNGTANRWAAIRGFISQTMERTSGTPT